VGVSTSDFDGERAAIEGGGVREQGAFPVEENLNGEDVALCQLQQAPDLLVPAHNTHVCLVPTNVRSCKSKPVPAITINWSFFDIDPHIQLY
jgi:hypothetical protein